MLTDKEMLAIAEHFLKKTWAGFEIQFREGIIKKPYGNIYRYQSKEYLLTNNIDKSLIGNAPFLVEKKTGRVVTFGTSPGLDDWIEMYENGTIGKSMDRYWYPDEERFDYK